MVATERRHHAHQHRQAHGDDVGLFSTGSGASPRSCQNSGRPASPESSCPPVTPTGLTHCTEARRWPAPLSRPERVYFSVSDSCQTCHLTQHPGPLPRGRCSQRVVCAPLFPPSQAPVKTQSWWPGGHSPPPVWPTDPSCHAHEAVPRQRDHFSFLLGRALVISPHGHPQKLPG